MDVDKDDLFGEISSSESSDNDEVKPGKEQSAPVAANLRDLSHDLDISDSEEEAEPRTSRYDEQEADSASISAPARTGGTIIEQQIDHLPRPLDKVYLVKLPNFLSIDEEPFDAESYRGIDDSETDVDKQTRVRLLVENTIRWREVIDEQGEIKRESNARMVEWSDGSHSLVLGNEVIDVIQKDITQENNHLYSNINQQILVADSVLDKKLTFKPLSTHSLTHKKLAMSIASKLAKTDRIQVLATDIDAEKQSRETIRMEDERIRARHKRENKQKRHQERIQSGPLSASYLEDRYEDDQDEDSINLGAISSNLGFGRKGNARRQTTSTPRPTMSSSQPSSLIEEDDFESRINRAKQAQSLSHDSETLPSRGLDDDDDDMPAVSSSSSLRKRRVATTSDDEE